ncbi:hypothetical protein H8959_005962 [Pygathrix nigripes]
MGFAQSCCVCHREWVEDTQLWIQQVSSTPSTRMDVVHLQEQLDLKLQQRQARETGICPVRRELYSQCFDELIREVTINCAERGLLLLRVRDEIRMTIAAYQTLYESSVAFGMRKALQAEQGKSDMERKIAELETEKRHLERQVNEQKAKCEATEKRESERRQVEEKKHNEEIQFLKRTNQQLKTAYVRKRWQSQPYGFGESKCLPERNTSHSGLCELSATQLFPQHQSVPLILQKIKP